MDRCGSHILLNTIFSKTLRILEVVFCITGQGRLRIVRVLRKCLVFRGFRIIDRIARGEFVRGFIAGVFVRAGRFAGEAATRILRTVWRAERHGWLSSFHKYSCYYRC
jgi:hypothetical protein